MATFGTQADLARHLGISRAAVSQAFKKHNIQISTDGKFDIDYAAWLLSEKQNKAKSSAQRSATKQPSGVKDPRTRREVLRLLLPSIFNEAIRSVLIYQADDIDEYGIANYEKDMEMFLVAYMCLWGRIEESINKDFPPELTDFPINKPDAIKFDPFNISFKDQIRRILSEKRIN